MRSGNFLGMKRPSFELTFARTVGILRFKLVTFTNAVKP